MMKHAFNFRVILAVFLLWFGVISTSQAVFLGTVSAGDEIFATATVDGTFNTDYTFKFGADVVSGQVGTAYEPVTLFGTTVLDFSALNVILTAPDTSIVIPLTSALGGWSTTLSTIMSGTYTLNVSGQTSGAGGGVYSVGISAVPIPAAVILFGTGLIGLIAVARRKQTPTDKMASA